MVAVVVSGMTVVVEALVTVVVSVATSKVEVFVGVVCNVVFSSISCDVVISSVVETLKLVFSVVFVVSQSKIQNCNSK